MTASINRDTLRDDGDGGRRRRLLDPRGAYLPVDWQCVSFDSLVREHSPFLLRMAQSLAPGLGVDSEDVVQDTLERAWRTRESFRGECSTRAWLCVILTNRVRDLARTRLRVFDRSWRLYRVEVACQRLAENTEEIIVRAEDESELRRALTALPFWERTAVLLHDCARLPAWEVGTVLGCSTEAAHKRIQRGRLRLAAELGRKSRSGSMPRPAPRSCRQTRKLMPSYLEGGLPEDERSALEAHIARCPHCPALVQAMWALLSVLADGKGVPEEVLARFRTRARAIAEGRWVTPRPPTPGRVRRRRRRAERLTAVQVRASPSRSPAARFPVQLRAPERLVNRKGLRLSCVGGASNRRSRLPFSPMTSVQGVVILRPVSARAMAKSRLRFSGNRQDLRP